MTAIFVAHVSDDRMERGTLGRVRGSKAQPGQGLRLARRPDRGARRPPQDGHVIERTGDPTRLDRGRQCSIPPERPHRLLLTYQVAAELVSKEGGLG